MEQPEEANQPKKHKWIKIIGWVALGLVIIFIFLTVGDMYFPYPSQVFTENISNRKTCPVSFTPRFNQINYYQGQLFDAHYHIPPLAVDLRNRGKLPELGKDITLDSMLCMFDKENTNGALGFWIPDVLPFQTAGSLNRPSKDALHFSKQAGNRFTIFLSPVQLNAKKTDTILNANPSLFKGLGEIIFYGLMSKNKPDDPEFLKLYQVAAKHNLPVMLHPSDNQYQNIANVLQANHNVVVIAHGHELADDREKLISLIDKYPNLYFSIDGATLYAYRGLFVFGPKDRFIAEFDKQFQSNLTEQVTAWKDLIETHPTRFMYGTDRHLSWHYDSEITSRFEEFGRAFIAKLDPSVQKAYAYQNAERLLNLNNTPGL